MKDSERLSQPEFETLRKRFEDHSRKAQAYYAIMHEARKIAGNDEAASAWMDQPVPGLGGRSPAELVAEDRTDELLHYIGSIKK